MHAKEPPPTYGMPTTRRPSTASSAIQFHRPHRGQLQLPPVTRHCDPGAQVHAKEPPPTYGMPTTRRLSTPPRLRHSQTLTTRWRNPCVFAWRETSTANKKTGLRTHIRNPVLSLSPTTIDTMPYQRKRTPPLIEVLSFPKSAPRPRSIWEKTRM